jgi:diguanylate cyclase (GGDEF)-like protein
MSGRTEQLAEFVAIAAGFRDAQQAMSGGAAFLADALDAEIALIGGEGQVLASVGVGDGDEQSLLQAAARLDDEVELPGRGVFSLVVASLGADDTGALVAARRRAFSREEGDLLRGMGRVMTITLRSIGAISELRERQELLERLSLLQRSIATRTALSEVFESIVEGASRLLGDETVGLRLILPDDPSRMEMVASRGVEQRLLPDMRFLDVGVGAGGRAIREGKLVVIEDYRASSQMVPAMVGDGIRAALAAPVFQRGEVVGSLVVATHRQGRSYSDSEREALLAFAEHAGLALNDAKAVEETAHQAFHDPLTGLPNRALFLDRLRVAHSRRARSDNLVAVLFADLDGFKSVNDSLGHAAGDEVLSAVGRRLAGCLRPDDTVARFGGDEFAILIEEVADPIDAARTARRALEILEAPFDIAGREVHVSASLGVAVGREEPEDLLRNADLAMYEAKGAGKGRYELFQHDMYRAMTERLELEQDLKRATEGGELVLRYQPIVALPSGRMVGVEALIRWMHPERGLIDPEDFIPLAEESGQIHEVGRWVLHEACGQMAQWVRPDRPLGLSANLSSAQLRQESLVSEVRGALASSGLDPSALVLEITETVLMDATASNIERLAALKELGISFAVDDFGTGYSSLQYLRRFPIDWLKIAKPFVDEVHRDRAEEGIARAIIDLARSLGLGVVAEGIEGRGQAARLADLGCSFGQGYFYSPPLPAEEIGELLESGGALGVGAERLKPPISPRRPGVKGG